MKIQWFFIALLLAGCGSERTEFYQFCDGLDRKIFESVSVRGFYSIKDVKDQGAYRHLLADEIVYFEKSREEVFYCVFNENKASGITKKQLLDLSGRVRDSLSKLHVINEDPEITDAKCSDCAPNLVNLIIDIWNKDIVKDR